MNQRFLITLGVALLLALGTIIAISWAKGYRPSFKEKTIKGTGLLVTNSYPEGASVYLNDKLTTATNDTLHLPPGEYKIKIVKDGFLPWEKVLNLEPELVFQTNARLFPSVPDLTALTFTGAISPTPSPNGQKIVYAVASASASLKNGLWVLDLSDSPIKFGSNHTQIAQNSSTTDFSQARLTWSPNSQQVLASLPNDGHFLLPADSLTKADNLKDISARLPLILEEWEKELAVSKQKRWEKLPEEMQTVASSSAQFTFFSPDETKIVYLATKEALIPEKLIPSLPATNIQPEEREIKPGRIYVYDLEEDRNFFIKTIQEWEELEEPESKQNINPTLERINRDYSLFYTPLPQWLPTSQHLIYIEEDKINIIEYDGLNPTPVFAGSFENSFVFPWPTGNKLIILTSLNSPDVNLYGINLR